MVAFCPTVMPMVDNIHSVGGGVDVLSDQWQHALKVDGS